MLTGAVVLFFVVGYFGVGWVATDPADARSLALPLDREGASGPGDVAMAGDEAYLRREIARLREIGVTDFDAAITPVEDGAYERTLSFLESELSGARK